MLEGDSRSGPLLFAVIVIAAACFFHTEPIQRHRDGAWRGCDNLSGHLNWGNTVQNINVEICSLDLDYYGQVIHECSSVT